jgi:Tol biopolymer transport system component
VAIDAVDETKYGVDLDKNGRITTAVKIAYEWAPRDGKTMSYVGQAKIEQAQGAVHLAAGMFPEQTEFLHTVRYVGFDDKDNITLSKRMKELRYMKKRTWQTYAKAEENALADMKERDDFPDRIDQIIGNAEQGINNGSGWILQGFIEDRNGSLRPQDFEETVSCIGCHGGMGINTDSVIGFPRKLASSHFQEGWYHWTQKGLAGLPEPKVEVRNGGVYYEYAYYLMYNRSGNDFRDNPEVNDKFFNPDGSVREDMLAQLHDNVAVLLHPSAERALTLNKAYQTIVQDQDYRLGREATVTPLKTVHESVAQDQPSGLLQATSIQQTNGWFGADDRTRTVGTSELRPVVAGKGMTGPSGIPYEVDWNGIIHKSRYVSDLPGVHFTFPQRLTLPTRRIVPVGNNSSCLTCHRIPYPAMPESHPTSGRLDWPRLPARAVQMAGMHQLTANRGQDQNGVWRPDGSMIAFVSNRTGAPQIWLMEKDGGSQQQLTKAPARHAWPDWSPDGSAITVWSFDPNSGTHSIKIVNVPDGTSQSLVTSSEMLDRPAFHPDGQLVAYAAQQKGNWDIWLVNLVDRRTTRLTSEPKMESNPLWSSDGKVLSYKVAPTTGVYNLTGQNFMTFENGMSNPTVHHWQGPQSVQMNHWSPDGGKIVYTAEVINHASSHDRVTYAAMISDLTLDATTAEASSTRLLAGGRTLGDRGPVFSPDGSKIAFWSWNKDATASIMLYDIMTSAVTALTAGGVDMYPQWSPDGTTILFETSSNGQVDLATLAVPSG